jgi:hypothetical protein
MIHHHFVTVSSINRLVLPTIIQHLRARSAISVLACLYDVPPIHEQINQACLAFRASMLPLQFNRHMPCVVTDRQVGALEPI